jgi:hypothetical protein
VVTSLDGLFQGSDDRLDQIEGVRQLRAVVQINFDLKKIKFKK